MLRTIEVEIDSAGHVHSLELKGAVPAGRALLTLLPGAELEIHRLSEEALAEDWLRPEEENAWAHLQRVE